MCGVVTSPEGDEGLLTYSGRADVHLVSGGYLIDPVLRIAPQNHSVSLIEVIILC